LSHAIKFTAQGAVTLKLSVQEQSAESVLVEITVKDTGIGIARSHLPHVFEEFTQANGDIGRLYGGTGLGLTISQRLVEMHGSRIAVESDPGKGTIFSFPLRLVIAPADGESAMEHNATNERWLHGMRVLVADDNAANLFVLSGLLRLWGVDLDVSTNGREAVERVFEGCYDLVLMDLRMPGLDGFAATRRIRAEPRFAHLPIFAISACDPAGQQGKLEAAGFTEFIGKPILPAVLFAKLARFAPRIETPM
jgi:CheY-like chemotaxis protein